MCKYLCKIIVHLSPQFISLVFEYEIHNSFPETMAMYESQGPKSVNSYYYYHFYIKEIYNTLNTDMCRIHCILEANCDFSTFYSGWCQLGSFTNGQTGSKNYGLLETFINPNDGLVYFFISYSLNLYSISYFLFLDSNAFFNEDGSYLSFTSPNNVWSKKIYEKRTDVDNEGICSAICTLNNPLCNLFVYVNKECLLGAFSKIDGSIVSTSSGETLIKFRRGNFLKLFN